MQTTVIAPMNKVMLPTTNEVSTNSLIWNSRNPKAIENSEKDNKKMNKEIDPKKYRGFDETVFKTVTSNKSAKNLKDLLIPYLEVPCKRFLCVVGLSIILAPEFAK